MKTILNNTAKILASTDGIGQVSVGMVAPRTQQELEHFLKPVQRGKEVDAWIVALDSMEESWGLPGFGAPLGSNFIGYTVSILGLVSGKDHRESTEKAWDYCEKIIARFQTERTLDGACLDRDNISVRDIGLANVGPVKVTRVSLSFRAWKLTHGLLFE